MKRPVLTSPRRGRCLTVLWAVLLPAACCLLASGCGGGESFHLAPVSGQVTLDGSALANVSVNFQPAPGTTGPASAGKTDAQGHFTLKTVGKSAKEGAVPGKHIVTLTMSGPTEMEDNAAGSAGSQLPRNASDGSLSFDVPAAGTDQANFELKSK
jgi:hypothetical protein